MDFWTRSGDDKLRIPILLFISYSDFPGFLRITLSVRMKSQYELKIAPRRISKLPKFICKSTMSSSINDPSEMFTFEGGKN